MTVTADQLEDIFAISTDRAKEYSRWLNLYMLEYEINTPLRAAAFLAQVGHESGRFYHTEEIASGLNYEGRKDLGNTQRGDGVRFKGRGLMQITGRSNYSQLSADTGIDFVSHPELLLNPEFAVMSACWYWKSRNLNELADQEKILAITKKINGGYNGLAEREKYYSRAKKVLCWK
jgi:predicted chitinase